MKYFDYKEKKQHGTFDFPIDFYYVTPNHPRYNMPYHWHTEWEIIRILEGEFVLTINDEKFLAHKGDIIFIHDGMFHGGNPNNCIYECIVFNINILLKQNHACTKQIQDIINQNKVVGPLLSNAPEKFKIFCDTLFESMKSKEIGYKFITQGSLYFLIGMVLEYKLYKTKSKNKKSRKTEEKMIYLKNVLTLIENEFQNPLTLDDLSRTAGMTPKYFCKFFSEMTNKTPIQYLNYYRVEIACEQLLATDYSITEIALNCGFNDVSYFIKTFKKYRGFTPKQYIRQYTHSQLTYK